MSNFSTEHLKNHEKQLLQYTSPSDFKLWTDKKNGSIRYVSRMVWVQCTDNIFSSQLFCMGLVYLRMNHLLYFDGYRKPFSNRIVLLFFFESTREISEFDTPNVKRVIHFKIQQYERMNRNYSNNPFQKSTDPYRTKNWFSGNNLPSIAALILTGFDRSRWWL